MCGARLSLFLSKLHLRPVAFCLLSWCGSLPLVGSSCSVALALLHASVVSQSTHKQCHALSAQQSQPGMQQAVLAMPALVGIPPGKWPHPTAGHQVIECTLTSCKSPWCGVS